MSWRNQWKQLGRRWTRRHVYRVATVEEEHELSLVYVYVTPMTQWPDGGYLKNQIRSEVRDTEITVDYAPDGTMLGIELTTRTEKDA